MTTSEHAKPLRPGEIRTHGPFSVMHVAGGSFIQAKGPDGVICTSMWEHAAVDAYADAIARFEDARPLANAALELIGQACATAEDQESGDDHAGALATLVGLTTDLVTLLAPHAGPVK
jgi:hypothetical protein